MASPPPAPTNEAAPAATAPLSRTQALAAIDDLRGFESRLSSRVGALTGMMWGMASAAIFVTYGLAGSTPGFPAGLMPFLWAPWALGAMLVTGFAWRLHAISLRRPYDRSRGRRFSLAFSALFAVALLVLFFAKPGIGPFVLMTLVNALVACILGGVVLRSNGAAASAPLFAAALLIAAAAIAIWQGDLDTPGQAFASAAAVGIGFLGAGVVGFVRG